MQAIESCCQNNTKQQIHAQRMYSKKAKMRTFYHSSGQLCNTYGRILEAARCQQCNPIQYIFYSLVICNLLVVLGRNIGFNCLSMYLQLQLQFLLLKLSYQADDTQTQWIPFISKFGNCYTMKPPMGKRLKTNMNDGMLVLKVQPGTYTVMVHDPKMLPIRYVH